MTCSSSEDAASASGWAPATASAFTDAEALRLGGWSPARARVLAAASDHIVAAALVDTNGDGRHLDVGLYLWRDDAWSAAGEYIDVTRHGMGEGGVLVEMRCDSAAGVTGRTTCTIDWGRSRPGSEVALELGGEWLTTTASPAGWWLALASTPHAP